MEANESSRCHEALNEIAIYEAEVCVAEISGAAPSPTRPFGYPVNYPDTCPISSHFQLSRSHIAIAVLSPTRPFIPLEVLSTTLVPVLLAPTFSSHVLELLVHQCLPLDPSTTWISYQLSRHLSYQLSLSALMFSHY